MPARKRKTARAAKPAPTPSPPRRLDPDRPFSEGVRGQESFYIQDGLVFDKTTRRQRGVLDG